MARRVPLRPLFLALLTTLAPGVCARAELPFVPLAAADISTDPQVQWRIDEIASSPSWESYYAGLGRSDLHAKFVDVAEALDEPQARALCSHKSPVVRAYAVRHYVENWPGHARRIYPLLRDSTQVDTVDGCTGGRASIAKFAVDSLCAMRNVGPVQDALLRAVVDESVHPWIRSSALRCVAATRPAQAITIGRAWLREKHDRAWIEGALRAMGEARAASEVPLVGLYVTHPDLMVRWAAVDALADIGDAGGLGFVLQATSDENVRVRSQAALAYARLAGAHPDIKTVARLLDGLDPEIAPQFESALAQHATPAAVALVERGLVDERDGVSVVSGRERAAALSWLHNLVHYSTSVETREAAVRALGELHHHPSAPEIRALLRGDGPVVMYAAEALAELQDVASVPDLEHLLETSRRVEAQLAAARALVKLRSRESARLLWRSAEAATHAQAGAELRTLAEALSRSSRSR